MGWNRSSREGRAGGSSREGRATAGMGGGAATWRGKGEEEAASGRKMRPECRSSSMILKS